MTRARQRLQLPSRFWALHDAVWGGGGFRPDPSEESAPQYTAEEVEGINALLAKMRSALPPAGAEMEDKLSQGSSVATAAPPAHGTPSSLPSCSAVSPAGSALRGLALDTPDATPSALRREDYEPADGHDAEGEAALDELLNEGAPSPPTARTLRFSDG